ncbi:MAG TPA: hypothetical protein VK636_04855 [Gemmatimonadaceae bacterium]|nr:hypothetical protein [Gemmatimonadaceae bacterium]
MTASTYRFLPWSRRGLADRITAADAGGQLPARAKVSVGLTVTATAESTYDVSVYGPGDVIGIDQQLIIRTDPRPNATDFEANYFPAIEFDPPDFPWLFTPAASGADNHLRPWCVLIVVDLSVVDAPAGVTGHPLPLLVVPSAVRSTELPDLAESWAWAHTQIVAPAANVALATALSDQPSMNVSRLVAPRRLEPGKRYAACLVPAFDAGVARGLHDTPPSDAPLNPAWSTSATGDVQLPVYFHWEFSTGPAGDFETLARRLRPATPPNTAGVERMYIGNAGPELPIIPPADPSAYLDMDGALRAPTRSSATLAEVPASIQSALRATLDAAAAQAQTGPTATTPAVGPPIYGQWHARQHTVPTDAPVWLRELNLDPRARVAAGLGAEIERQNQEDFMQWSWEQVGRILEGIRLLSQSRLSMETLVRVHTRHIAALPPDRLFQMAAPLHSRATQGAVTIRAKMEQSSLPNAAGDPALRRLTSAQNPTMRAAVRRAARMAPAATAAATPARIVPKLATGELDVDPTRFIPSGLVGVRETLDFYTVLGGMTITLDEIGMPTFILLDAYDYYRSATTAVGNLPIPGIPVRANITTIGIVAEAQVQPTRESVGASTIPGTNLTRALTSMVSGATPVVHDVATVSRLQQSIAALAANNIVGAPAITPKFVPFVMPSARDTLVARMNPRLTVPARLQTMINANGVALGMPTGAQLAVQAASPVRVAPTYDRIMAAPELDVPVYSYLAKLDPKRFMPGVGDVPSDSIMLLETNPRFIEALLVGLNSEMNRELLWREFPTDQRGTPFKRFWSWSDGGADIAPIHTWPATNALGSNTRASSGGQIALMIRGRLLQRYPNTSIFAWRAKAGKLINPPAASDIRRPIFAGVLGTDIAFAGFDLTDVELNQGDGWFFVLQEQPTEPRFGFDEGSGATPPAITAWSDATWDHTATAPGHYLRITGNPLSGVLHGTGRFVDHAGHLASITIQKPVCVAVHARAMVQATTP